MKISIGGVDISLGRSGRHETFQRPTQKKPVYFRSSAKNNLPPFRSPVNRYLREAAVDIFDDKKGKYQIIIDLPYHKETDLKWGIIERRLKLKSLLKNYDYCEEFSLPEEVLTDSLMFFFKNGLFVMTFEKQ
ncbi:MAG: hypothetical protein L6275_03965 [Candidatus Portnoybacteria bacterium]|nr:hypothetical protein [Candidatus Portnoybacteria bacterium]